MLCKICIDMLQDGKGQIWTGTMDITFEPHKSTTSLWKSADSGCSICTTLYRTLKTSIDHHKEQPISVRAFLKKLDTGPQEGARFLLDYEVQHVHKLPFVLTETNRHKHTNLVKSFNTGSEDVFELASRWIKRCKCAQSWDKPGLQWYPKRLLDIESLCGGGSKLHRAKVRLIEMDDVASQTCQDYPEVRSHGIRRYRYVTLSHCWGKPKIGHEPLKLTSNTRAQFLTEGVELNHMPKTFRDTLLFASRLEGVRYVWIDSLCIRQPLKDAGLDPNEQNRDWMEQGRLMDKIYQKAYLNISATASTDGDGGLFFARKPELLVQSKVGVRYPSTKSTFSVKDVFKKAEKLTSCSVFDVSEWENMVEHAHINRRGWVVQERILAPRVLHFCYNRIAWECSEFQHTEGFPENTPILKDLGNRLEALGPAKDLTPGAGLKLRNIRLRGLTDPDLSMADLDAFELWKRVVETYSKTQLTYLSDKLMALAGIARHFSTNIFSESAERRYVAGMWSSHLESQLLWFVNELYRKDSVEFQNPAKRDTDGLPSFSWAAIHTPLGITYADVTDYGAAREGSKKRDHDEDMENSKPAEELFFEILDCNISLADIENPFGSMSGGHLLLRPRFLRPIELYKLPEKRRVPYAWRLKHSTKFKRLPEHTNIYLDAPDSDFDIFDEHAELYCMAGAYGDRTVRRDDRYLFCLLLKLHGWAVSPESDRIIPDRLEGGYRVFKRIGLTKLSHTLDARGQEALKEEENVEPIYLL